MAYSEDNEVYSVINYWINKMDNDFEKKKNFAAKLKNKENASINKTNNHEKRGRR